MQMFEIGTMNKLKISREVDFGFYLDAGKSKEILLPRNCSPRNCRIGDELEVFIYLDSEDRLIAATQKPKAMLGEFAFLKVVSVNQTGAFLDWGLPKDLLVPFGEQKQKMKEGLSYIVMIYLDEKTKRLAATSKLGRFLNKKPADYKEGEEADLLICEETEIGRRVIINESHWGMLYKNEIFQKIECGQRLKGYIKKMRGDNKIDVSLQRQGYERTGELSGKILDELEKNNGFLPFGSQSPPEEIYRIFGASKKSFKMAIGALYKNRTISIEDDGIKLLKPDSEK
jgi:predicted RNA-binding protein (virulence factor B family)